MLNATFLVQAMHFFIAYVIVERLLFRPAVREIQADQLEKKHLKEAVEAQALIVKTLEQERQAAWQSACKQFKETMPPIKPVRIAAIPQELPVIPVLRAQRKAEIIDECVAALLKEVEHVH